MPISRLTILVAVAVLTVSFLSIPNYGQSPAQSTHSNDLSHFVHFERGGTQLRDGDHIAIDEVHGTTDTISPGHLYEIKGTYTLASRANASLAVEVTSSDTHHYPAMNTQSITVDRGTGRFTVYIYMWTPGYPHMSFYPTGRGSSFASVYFGTGDSTLKQAGWLDSPNP